MNGLLQTIIVPVVKVLPYKAIAYAEVLSLAYAKPIVFLCLDAKFLPELKLFPYTTISSELGLSQAIEKVVEDNDPVMFVFQVLPKRFLVQQQLNACRHLRIPYFFVPSTGEHTSLENVALPMSFLIEDREKATWGRSLHRYFKSEFTILKPKDKGSRALKNVEYVGAMFNKLGIPYKVLDGRKSSFANDKEVFALLSHWANLVIVTASREYGLDDHLLGPKELHLIRKSALPIMVLNPRGDLYILCGD